MIYALSMEKGKRKKQEHDFAVNAFRVMQEATGQTENEPAKEDSNIDFKALGRKGGLKGGKARAEKLTPEQRSEIAKKAAASRWRDKQV
jgi:undecaprenyl pyrophosphate synthase